MRFLSFWRKVPNILKPAEMPARTFSWLCIPAGDVGVALHCNFTKNKFVDTFAPGRSNYKTSTQWGNPLQTTSGALLVCCRQGPKETENSECHSKQNGNSRPQVQSGQNIAIRWHWSYMLHLQLWYPNIKSPIIVHIWSTALTQYRIQLGTLQVQALTQRVVNPVYVDVGIWKSCTFINVCQALEDLACLSSYSRCQRQSWKP